MKRYYSGALIAVAWIGLLCLRTAHGFEPAWFFLFDIKGKAISAESAPEFSRYELWQMREGIIGLIGILLFSILFLICLYQIITCPSFKSKQDEK